MIDPALQTFALLLTGHLLADFALQTGWMVTNKHRLPVLGLHVAIVFIATFAALGGSPLPVLAITAVHFVVDYTKVHALPDRFWAFTADQVAHIATLGVAVWWMPDAAQNGLWASDLDTLIPLALLACGFVLASPGGGPVVGYLMAPYRDVAGPDGLPNAGRMIGLLERALIFLLVMIGEPAGIGFLIAAKSILRFNTVSNDRALTEYVIIGTLASFGWALIAGLATGQLLNLI